MGAFAPAAPSMLSRSKVARPQPAMGIGGVNGALDFGNLASGVGGEGTGIALGANEPALLAIVILVPSVIAFLFSGWTNYQEDRDDDFFDTYDSRRTDRESPTATASRRRLLAASCVLTAVSASRK